MTAEDLTRMNRVLRHRLRNTASGMKSSVALLAEELKDIATPDLLEYFPLLTQECDRLTEVTERLDALFDRAIPAAPFGAAAAPEGTPDGVALAAWLADGLRRRFPGVRVTDDSDTAASGCAIPDPKRAMAALAEIGVNAAEAAGRSHDVRCYANVRDGSVALGVHQGGEPVAPEAISQMVLPFFTTKSRHLGVGLNLARKWAEECGGGLHVFPAPEGGLTVELCWPETRRT